MKNNIDHLKKVVAQAMMFAHIGQHFPGLVKPYQDAQEMKYLVELISKFTGIRHAEAYFEKLKTNARTYSTTDQPLDKLKEYHHQLHNLINICGLSWTKIRYECWRQEMNFEDMYDFYMAFGRYPTDGEAISIIHFGVEGIISSIRDDGMQRIKETFERVTKKSN